MRCPHCGEGISASFPDTPGGRVARLLSERGLTIKALEVECDISHGVAWRLVNNKSNSIGFDSLVKIAKYLNVTTDYLLTGVQS